MRNMSVSSGRGWLRSSSSCGTHEMNSRAAADSSVLVIGSTMKVSLLPTAKNKPAAMQESEWIKRGARDSNKTASDTEAALTKKARQKAKIGKKSERAPV